MSTTIDTMLENLQETKENTSTVKPDRSGCKHCGHHRSKKGVRQGGMSGGQSKTMKVKTTSRVCAKCNKPWDPW